MKPRCCSGGAAGIAGDRRSPQPPSLPSPEIPYHLFPGHPVERGPRQRCAIAARHSPPAHCGKRTVEVTAEHCGLEVGGPRQRTNDQPPTVGQLVDAVETLKSDG